MKLYRLKSGVLFERNDQYYFHPDQQWDEFINDDDLLNKLTSLTRTANNISDPSSLLDNELISPLGNQELWACGVTYLRSKVGRQEESKAAGGGDFYAKVYEAERPEVFFKSMSHRVSGHKENVRIRKDSTWDVPEPELTLVVSSSGKIVGYTIGNDMSSRSIEGENPLYLPQAKTYDGCAAVGPCIFVTDKSLPEDTMIRLVISRNDKEAFNGDIAISQMKRTPEELVSFVYRECTFPHGAMIMTGTGIVPGSDFTLQSGDKIEISIDQIGTLLNYVE